MRQEQNNENLKKTVDEFYNDLINIYNNRIKKNNDKIEQNLNEEDEIKKKIEKFKKEMDKINQNAENHINKNKDYHLIPVMYEDFDRNLKEKEYLEKELEFLKHCHEEEKENINEKNREYLDKCQKYINEKYKILECIITEETKDILKERTLQEQELSQLRTRNDAILQRYSSENTSLGTPNN